MTAHKPFAELSMDELRALNEHLSGEVSRYRKLFVDSRTPSLARIAKEAPQLLFGQLDDSVTDLARVYRERQRNFDTVPFDPPGRSFRLFPGGITIWSGSPGHGKTTLIRQLVCHLLYAGRGVFVASLEERPDDTLVRLMMTAGGDLEPDEERMSWFQHAYIDSGRLSMWGEHGLAPYRAILSAMQYAIQGGARHCVIDSLTCLDVGASDWDAQRGLANELAAIARTTHTHIHLVAHPRKPQNPKGGPDLADVAGSSDLVRLADNVLFVRRNSGGESQDFNAATPMEILVLKQRHGTGMCGSIEGYFHRAHRQYTADPTWRGPVKYLPDQAYGEFDFGEARA